MTTEQAWNEYGKWLDAWNDAHNADGEFDALTALDMTAVFGVDTDRGVEAGLAEARRILAEQP